MLKFFAFMCGMLLISLSMDYIFISLGLVLLTLSWVVLEGSSVMTLSLYSLDQLSWALVLLTFWITMLMVLASNSYYFSLFYPSRFSGVLMSMMILLVLTFSSMDLIYFYLFFEASLIPIYLLIVGWGYQPERLQAGIYMLLYTILASLPLLISLFYMSSSLEGSSFWLLSMGSLNFDMPFWFLISVLAFFVKLPVFYFHLWLPKAHVEAPVSGSMMLAGVLLKLGCYGLMRIMMYFNVYLTFISSFIVSLGLIGGLSVGFICMRQVDLKSLIAYSSVSHMGLVLAGLGAWSLWGYSGSLYMCIAHGLCSSGLFYLSGVTYERSGTRMISMNKGLLNIMPSMSFWWFLMCTGNLGAPISLNLLGELGLIGSVVGFSNYSSLFIMMFSFMGACYSLYLFSGTQHGGFYSGIHSMFDGLTREHLVLLLHFYPLIILMLEIDLISF
uniref:NADH dehydrogenase subunit 4 n=1 Tax=Octolasmis warwickii TaxID=479288 RepID=UPI0021CC752A|nr:NADH dehydrogenase subunit 4 [Octolasmis warwickii]UWM12955.1 NADH dehydrogenase subunit 4 [Octolasmis warwickii]